MRPTINIILLVLLSISLFAANATSGQEVEHGGEKVRVNWKLPEVFSFRVYKENFGKHYKSALEETVRVKLFLARAYRAFVAAIKYKFRQSSYYLAVNARSDWTHEELDLSRMSTELEKQPKEKKDANDDDDEQLEAVEPAELEAELERIEERAHEPGYKQLAQELERVQAAHRTKREARKSARVRDFDVRTQSLERPRSLEQDSTRRGKRIASNNPNYKPPELKTEMSLEELSKQEHFKPVRFNRIDWGKEARTYDHLPVKGKYKLRSTSLYTMTSNLVSGLIGWLSGGGGGGATSEQELEPVEADIVWVDHRRDHCLAPIQEQGQCGSCYVFASLALMEWAHCKESGGILTKFSEQYIVDCGNRIDGLRGCRGGLVSHLAYFFNNFGLETRLHYPYRARQEACPYAPDTPMAAMGYLRPEVMNYNQIPVEFFEEHLNSTPLVINLHTKKTDFSEYGGGVWDGKSCVTSGDHSVLLIGHGREDGEEYWLIRNSYSSDYGEQGHLKLNKNSNCIHPKWGFVFGRMRKGRVTLNTERNPLLPVPVKQQLSSLGSKRARDDGGKLTTSHDDDELMKEEIERAKRRGVVAGHPAGR